MRTALGDTIRWGDTKCKRKFFCVEMCYYWSERARKRDDQIVVSSTRGMKMTELRAKVQQKGHQIPGTAPGVTDLSDATETSHQWQLVNPAGEEEAQDFCRGTLWGLCKFT